MEPLLTQTWKLSQKTKQKKKITCSGYWYPIKSALRKTKHSPLDKVKEQLVSYEEDNKSGRMLARALRAVRARNHISHIKHENSTVARSSPKTAMISKTYYTQLYNLASPSSGADSTSKGCPYKAIFMGIKNALLIRWGNRGAQKTSR